MLVRSRFGYALGCVLALAAIMVFFFYLGRPLDSSEIQEIRDRADRGYTGSQQLLGRLYMMGKGVPKDDVQAYMWLNLAGQTDDEAAKSRDSLASKMTSEQIAEAQRLSREWKPRVKI